MHYLTYLLLIQSNLLKYHCSSFSKNQCKEYWMVILHRKTGCFFFMCWLIFAFVTYTASGDGTGLAKATLPVTVSVPGRFVPFQVLWSGVLGLNLYTVFFLTGSSWLIYNNMVQNIAGNIVTLKEFFHFSHFKNGIFTSLCSYY